KETWATTSSNFVKTLSRIHPHATPRASLRACHLSPIHWNADCRAGHKVSVTNAARGANTVSRIQPHTTPKRSLSCCHLSMIHWNADCRIGHRVSVANDEIADHTGWMMLSHAHWIPADSRFQASSNGARITVPITPSVTWMSCQIP